MINKKYICQLFLVLFLTVMHSQSANADITLAIIAPKAGEHVKAGKELFNGAKIAINEINEAGGLLGEKLDILTIDDRCDDRLAISTAEMLTLLSSKKIGLVVGPYCSNRFNEAADIYEKAKIFQIVPTTVTYNTGSSEKKGQILLLGTKSQISKDFFKFYNNNFAGLKVGFIYNNTPEDGYAEVAQTLFDEFQHYGKRDLLKLYKLEDVDGNFHKLSKRIAKDNVSIVFILSKENETVELIRNLRNENENQIIFIGKNNITSKKLENLGGYASGIYIMDLPKLKDSLAFTENLVNLRLSGYEPEGMETYSYVAVKLWGELVKSVKSFSYDKLSATVNSGEVREKWSEFLMHSGSVKSSKYIIEFYQNGEFKQVY